MTCTHSTGTAGPEPSIVPVLGLDDYREWSHLSLDGQAAPTIAEAIAEKVERRRQFMRANRTTDVRLSPYQAKSHRRGRAPPRGNPADVEHVISTAGGIQQAFPDLIPAKPYCGDELEHGLFIRARTAALKRRHVQFNGPGAFVWMPHDIDHPGAYFAHRDANVPEPNVIAINRANGYGHSAVLLATPVARHSASRVEPLRFYGAVERGIARRIGADRRFVGLIVKNPVHADWLVEWRREEPYTLGELADWLFPRDMVPDTSPSTTLGAGRNCTVFDELHAIAYREVREFKRRGETVEAFRARLERVAIGLNLQFPVALPINEIRNIAKSVAGWIWKQFSVEKFRSRQKYLSARANAKRWAGHVAESTTKPWVAMGISRATYYRRKSAEKL